MTFKVRKKFDSLSLRERILLVVVSMVILYGLWHIMLYDYVLATDQEISQKVKEIQDQIMGLEGQIDTLSGLLGRNPTSVLLAQATELKNINDTLGQKIIESTKKMVTPKDMTKILSDLIEKTSDLTVTSMESIPTTPLFNAKNLQEDGKTRVFQVFKQGLRVEMIGGFFETLKFLKALEQTHINVIWDELTYEVQEYPKAKVVIVLHTLSLEEGWIGV